MQVVHKGFIENLGSTWERPPSFQWRTLAIFQAIVMPFSSESSARVSRHEKWAYAVSHKVHCPYTYAVVIKGLLSELPKATSFLLRHVAGSRYGGSVNFCLARSSLAGTEPPFTRLTAHHLTTKAQNHDLTQILPLWQSWMKIETIYASTVNSGD